MGNWIKIVIVMRYRLTPQTSLEPYQEINHRTALFLAHDIHTVNNHNLYTSLVTFNITGDFNNVNDNILL